MTSVEVTTGSRLHFGLLCGAPDSGWHYGGIGLMIDQPAWHLRVSLADNPDDRVDASPPVQQRLKKLLVDFRRAHRDLPQVRIATISEVGFHSGLGSGTQLTLAAGTALLLLSGRKRPANIADLAANLGRSRRSSIGTFGFDRGGFVVDHGKSADGQQLPLERHAFPEDWRMVLVTPQKSEGLSGTTEETFFDRERFLDATTVATVQSLIEQQITPSIRDHNFDNFRNGLAAYGNLVGEYYAPAQGGIYSSTAIRDLVSWLKPHGVDSVVQSSWGPTVCIPASNPEHAESVISTIRRYPTATSLDLRIAASLNTGATVRSVAPEHQRSFG